MKKRKIFTSAQRHLLEKNEYVLHVTERRIQYAPEFKKKAVREYLEDGKDPRSIFADAGFPESVFDSKLPNWMLKDWRKVAGTEGSNANFTDKRGRGRRSQDPKTMTDKEKIEYYEATIAYKEAENQFLAEARGLQRWPKFVWNPGENSRS
jgi:hypothetical protein